jgi:hypothetical protein
VSSEFEVKKQLNDRSMVLAAGNCNVKLCQMFSHSIRILSLHSYIWKAGIFFLVNFMAKNGDV